MKKLLFIFALLFSAFAGFSQINIAKQVQMQPDAGLRLSGVPYTFLSVGDSYTVGVGATPNSQGYSYLLNTYYGLGTYSNLGVSSTGAWQAVKNHYANVSPGHSTFTTAMFGFNNARKNGSAYTTLRKIVNGFNSVFVNQYLKNYSVANSGTNVTLYGAWTSFDGTAAGSKTLTNGAKTSTLNDSLVYTFNDSTVAFGGFGTDSSSATYYYSESIQVLVDNVLKMTISQNNMTDGIDPGGESYANHLTPQSYFISGLTYGPHTLKLINKTAHSYPMTIDFVGNLVDSKVGMPLIVYEIPKMNATGYATSGYTAASNTVMNTLNASIDSLLLTFPQSYPVFLVKTNNYMNTSTDLYADSIHPNNTGHLHLAQGAEAAIAFRNAAGVVKGTMVQGAHEYSTDGKLIVSDSSQNHTVAYVDDIKNGRIPISYPGGSIGNIFYWNNGQAANTSNLFYDTTYHGLAVYSPNLGAVQANATGLYLRNTTLSAVSGKQYPPSIVMEGSAYNSTASASQPYRFVQWAALSNGTSISGVWHLDYQNNSLVNNPGLVYQPGVGLGVNTNVGLSGALDIYQQGTSYGVLSRLSTGLHFANLGAKSTTQGALVFDGNLSGTGMLFDASGNFTFAGYVSTPKVQNTAAQTVVSGSTSGSATYSQPEQGSSWKRVIVYCNGLNGTAAYTYPTAFNNTPVITFATSGITASVGPSATAVTLSASNVTGYVIIEGY